jgi:2-polyprenyl-3-methyl-5-hydroxy-6-metoxy-1,4-benzoquinol methylase
MIDFGSSYGYLGLKLMDMLPKVSTYTGIDISAKLISEAEELFKDVPFQSTFMCEDIYEVQLDRKYDIAICQQLQITKSNF